jgi:hypothetical protein
MDADPVGGCRRLPSVPDTPALAMAPRILDEFDRDLGALGVVDARLPAARLLYLAVTSRLFKRPVSIVVKGPSSAGKSWLVERVLELFPPSAFHKLTSMSEKSLVYDTTPLAHKMLVVGEAVGVAGPKTGDLLREMLSSGHIKHATVENRDGELVSKTVEREGPTGLISTTTSLKLHGETETRLLSVRIGDSKAAQRAIQARWGARLAGDDDDEVVDLDRWREFGGWLESGEHRVVAPFGRKLGELMPTTAVRLQRDLITIGGLIHAHALVHRTTRERDAKGRIVATLEDYGVVRNLCEPIVSAGVGASVRRAVRAVVDAVENLSGGVADITQSMVCDLLQRDKGNVSRDIAEAIENGWLVNDEPRPSQPARLRLGDPMPDDGTVLPLVEALW